MLKNSIIALATAAALAGIAAPAMASDSLSDFETYSIVNQLHARGVNAVDVQEWGTLLRASVDTGSGSQVFQYFDPDTLQQVRF